MSHSTLSPTITIGIDLGKRTSRYCVLNAQREIIKEDRVETDADQFKDALKKFPRSRVVIEACGISPWVDRALKAQGHEVIVANPRATSLISKNHKKTDRTDAQILARLGAADVQLLSPITHRGEEAQRDLITIRLRDAMVRSRTLMILSLRGNLEALGVKTPSCSSESVHKIMERNLTKELWAMARPILEAIHVMTDSIKEYDREIERAIEKDYPEAKQLQTVDGVGPVTSLAYVLTIDDPKRFKKSRDVCAYVGLTPRKRQSGDKDPQLRITKAGNKHLRTLLVQCAHRILGHFGRDSDLREWGLKLAERGGKNAKKRAIVAVARKLAMILHRMWTTQTDFIYRRHEPHTIAQRNHKPRSKRRTKLQIVK